MKSIIWLVSIIIFCTATALGANQTSTTKTCVVPAHGNGEDDSPSIKAAFNTCRHNGHVIFSENQTYSIQQVLQLHNLSNVHIDLRGTLLVWTHIPYNRILIYSHFTSTRRMCATGSSTGHTIHSKTYQLHWSYREITSLLMDIIQA